MNEYSIITARGDEGIEVWLYSYEGGERQSDRSLLNILSTVPAAKAYAERQAEWRSEGAAQLTLAPNWLRPPTEDRPSFSRSAWVWRGRTLSFYYDRYRQEGDGAFYRIEREPSDGPYYVTIGDQDEPVSMTEQEFETPEAARAAYPAVRWMEPAAGHAGPVLVGWGPRP